MANTIEYKTHIEPWFIDSFVRQRHPDCSVSKSKVSLKWGGVFECDAVVTRDGIIEAVYCLSCSEYLTHGGNPGPGKFNKIRADVLMMTAIESPIRMLVFTGKTMYDRVVQEQKNGRLPPDVSFDFFPLTESLSTIVHSASAKAVAEVTPGFTIPASFTDYDPSSGIVTFDLPLAAEKP